MITYHCLKYIYLRPHFLRLVLHNGLLSGRHQAIIWPIAGYPLLAILSRPHMQYSATVQMWKIVSTFEKPYNQHCSAGGLAPFGAKTSSGTMKLIYSSLCDDRHSASWMNSLVVKPEYFRISRSNTLLPIHRKTPTCVTNITCVLGT